MPPRRPGVALREPRPLRLPPGQHAHPRQPRRAPRARSRRAWSTRIATLGNTSAASVPLALEAGATQRRPARRHARAARRGWLGLHLGSRRRRVGDGMSAERPPTAACALVTGGSRGIGAATARALARRWLAGRTDLPQRRAAGGGRGRGDRGGRRARAPRSWPDVSDPAHPGGAAGPPPRKTFGRARRSSSSTTPACAPMASRSRSPTRTGGAVLDTNLGSTYRLTRAALRADDPGAVRTRDQHRLGRPAPRQRRTVQLRGLQGGRHRFHQDRGGRGGAARRHDQRGRSRA